MAVDDPDVTLAAGAHAVAERRPSETVGARRGSHGGAPSATTEAPPGAATLLLRLPDDESAANGPLTVAVNPGERVIVLGLIRNESGIVDNYDIAVSGLAEGWWTATPPTAYLVPYGTSGKYEQEIQLHVHPPRTPEAYAKPWAIEVVASSRTYEAQVASAPATITIEPYQDVAAKLAPDRASGRLKARYKLTARNRANAPAEVLLSAEDADGECQFRFAQPSVTIEPGRGVEAGLTVFAPKQIWIGRAKARPIRVTAAPTGAAQPSPPLPATFWQKPWLPWWVSIVAPIAAALVALFIVLQPKPTLVPNLKTANSVFAAEKLLVPLGLRIAPQPTRVTTASAPPGSIIDQTPAVGKKVKRGTSVLVTVAVASNKVKVPTVVGLTPVAADTALRAAGLGLGAVSPQPPNTTGTIAAQIPSSGMVAAGTPVAVFLKPSVSAKAGGGAGNSNGGSGTPQAGKLAKQVAVPAVAGGAIAVAANLSQLGFVPSTVRQFSAAASGTVVGTDPPAGRLLKPGAHVTLLVSAGYPELSYDDDEGVVHVADGASGAPRACPPLNPSAGSPVNGAPCRGRGPTGDASQWEQEASWSPDGRDIVYIQGGQLWLWAPNQPGVQPRALTNTGGDDHDPAFAPRTNPEVLAYIDESGGVGRLCFATVGPNMLIPECKSVPGFSLAHQISWSHDGRRLLVPGAQPCQSGQGDRFGLIRFTTNEPSTAHADAWDQGQLVTDASVCGVGVIAGAFSPDGKQVALVSNIAPDNPSFHLFLVSDTEFNRAPGENALAHARALGIPACQVSWRSDSKELAVMQADSGCMQDKGNITASDLTGHERGPLATYASHPAWQPVPLDG